MWTVIASLIPGLVQTVNGLIGGRKKGREKKAAVLSALESLVEQLAAAQVIASKPSSDELATAIDATHGVMKARGEIDGPGDAGMAPAGSITLTKDELLLLAGGRRES